MDDRQVEHCIAAERGDQRVVGKDGADIVGVIADPRPVLDENLLRPEGRVERLAPADRIGGRVAAVAALDSPLSGWSCKIVRRR